MPDITPTYIFDSPAYTILWMAIHATEVVAYKCRAKCKGKVLTASDNDCKARIEAMLRCGEADSTCQRGHDMTGALTKLYMQHHAADKASMSSSTTHFI